MNHLHTQILQHLLTHPGADQLEIAQALRPLDINTVGHALADLQDAGHVAHDGLFPPRRYHLTHIGNAHIAPPDTPATPTPPTIDPGHPDGQLVVDPDDRRHVAWLTRELARAEGRDPSLMDAYRFEEDAVVVAKALRAMRDQQPADEAASFEGENRATPSPARVADAIAASIGKRVGVDPATGDPRLEDAFAPTLASDLAHTRQLAAALVDELDARMRDRLRAWGLQCGASSSSDQETPR